jgi:hypothetical protein
MCFDINKIQLSHDLREALKANPYKIVNNTFDAIMEDKKAISLVNEYVSNEWHYNFCKLMPIDVSCLYFSIKKINLGYN